MTGGKPSSLTAFLRHSTVYAFGNVLNRAGAFLLLPLYTRLLPVDQYGALELFWSSSSVLSAILSLGLPHATLRFYFEYEDAANRGRVVTTCILTTLLYAVPCLLAITPFNEPVARFVFGDARYASGLSVVYTLVVTELIRQIGLAYFRAREYSGLFVTVCFIQLVLQVGANVYTVGVGGWGVEGVLWGNLASVAAGTLFVLGVVVKECGLGYDSAKMKAIFHYSYPFVLTAVFGVILQNVDRVILRAFFSLQAVGLYALAYKFGSLVHELLFDPFNRNFGAYRFKIMNEPGAPALLGRLFGYVMAGATFMGLGIALFSHDVLRLVAGRDYWAAGYIVPWIVLALLVGGMSYTFQTGMLYQKRTHSIVPITLSSGTGGALLNFLLIPPLGALGAALAAIGRSVVEAGVTYRISQRLFPVPYDNSRVLRIFACAALLAAAGGFVPGPLPITLAAHTALLAAFPLLLVTTGTVSRGDLQRLREAATALLRRPRTPAAPGGEVLSDGPHGPLQRPPGAKE